MFGDDPRTSLTMFSLRTQDRDSVHPHPRWKLPFQRHTLGTSSLLPQYLHHLHLLADAREGDVLVGVPDALLGRRDVPDRRLHLAPAVLLRAYVAEPGAMEDLGRRARLHGDALLDAVQD